MKKSAPVSRLSDEKIPSSFLPLSPRNGFLLYPTTTSHLIIHPLSYPQPPSRIWLVSLHLSSYRKKGIPFPCWSTRPPRSPCDCIHSLDAISICSKIIISRTGHIRCQCSLPLGGMMAHTPTSRRTCALTPPTNPITHPPCPP